MICFCERLKKKKLLVEACCSSDWVRRQCITCLIPIGAL